MTSLLFSLLTAAPAVPAAEPAPDVLAIHRALSVRHPEPECAAVEALSPAPVPALLQIVDAPMPPWAALRAARCLAIGHALEVRPQLAEWMRAPDKAGLMLVVLGVIDQVPKEVALELAAIAVREGPDPTAARARLLQSADPELAALGRPPEAVPAPADPGPRPPGAPPPG